MLLISPEYESFQQLGGTMTDIPCQVPGAVKIKIIQQGDGPLIPSKALVEMHYSAYWEHDRHPFSSTFKRSKKPKKIVLGGGFSLCLEGLQLALTNVRGPTAHLLVLLEPEIMWKPEEQPQRDQLAPVLFVIFVIAVKELQAHNLFYYLKTEEQAKYEVVTSTVQYLREKAKGLFQIQCYNRAREAYDRACDVMDHCCPKTDQEKQAIKDLEVQVLVNMAVCYYKLDKPKRVLIVCSKINEKINIDTNCKALFYKGRAYEKLLHDKEALEQYKKALNLEPNNREICTAMSKLSARINNFKAEESNMWQNVFNKLKEENGNKAEEKPETAAGANIPLKMKIIKVCAPAANVDYFKDVFKNLNVEVEMKTEENFDNLARADGAKKTFKVSGFGANANNVYTVQVSQKAPGMPLWYDFKLEE